MKRTLSKPFSFDRQLKDEIQLSLENDYGTYKKEEYLFNNYKKKVKKNKFDFAKAEKGELNLIVTPFSRGYQKEWGIKVPIQERKAIAKSRVRNFWKEQILNE